MIGEVTYTRIPEDWDQERFLALGGFTVVFLNYNKAQFIEKSVASALAQDFPLCEMFFMDDASPDGSGDTMENLVLEYRGRHKVTVVRNTENQHICGQWNIVSKLATGNWFGMFCGDDEALPDRVSKIAARIRQYPTLKGICTNGVSVDIAHGNAETPMIEDRSLIFSTGKYSLVSLAEQRPPIVGATAFWHKSLFTDFLPKAPMDDVLLRWVLQSKNLGRDERVYLWDGESCSVKYAVGSGITSEMRNGVDRSGESSGAWLSRKRAMKKFDRLMIETVKGIERYCNNCDVPIQIKSALRYKLLYNQILAGNSLLRLVMLPRVFCFVLLGCVDVSAKRKLLILWAKITAQEFFGDRVASVLSTMRR